MLIAVALVFAWRIIAVPLVSPLLTEGAVRGTVKLLRYPIKAQPEPNVLEVMLGEVGNLDNGDTVWIRCEDGPGKLKLVRRPPLFRDRYWYGEFVELEERVKPC